MAQRNAKEGEQVDLQSEGPSPIAGRDELRSLLERSCSAYPRMILVCNGIVSLCVVAQVVGRG